MALVRILTALALVVGACSSGSDDDGAAPSTTDRDGTRAAGGYEAEIIRTADGVAHIRGDTIDDVIFGQGWASGEDRPCDLIDQVLKIRGERARFFGAEHADGDIAWLAVGIFDRAVEDFAEAGDEVRSLFESFTDGWNAQFDSVGADGLTGWCAGEDWARRVQPVEVYAYARSLALQASSGAVLDYLHGVEPPTGTDESAAPDGGPGPVADGLRPLTERPVASNGWAIGADRSVDGGGLLVGNPHFPWEGPLRFWESHLTVPGELDLYGAQLTGVPGIGIGFTDTFAWTHTVSIGNRFTGYTLDLVEGDPTSYRYGDEIRKMTSSEVTIELLGSDGELTERTETLWRSHYGPIVSVPGLGWTAERAVTFRDANIDNDEFVEQYVAMNQADDLDEFIAAHREHTGVPLFNTIAVSDDGRAWYADTSATPNLSEATLAGWDAAKGTDLVVGIAAQNGLVLLDGSDPANEWVDAAGARDPGLVPFDEMPMTERTDHVFNANDSYWLSNAGAVLEGGFSPLHGPLRVEQSVRTRQNAVVLGDVSPDGPAGADGRFDLDELRDLSLDNQGRTAALLREQVVSRCRAEPTVVLGPDESPDVIPDERSGERIEVDLAAACDVLDRWDGRYDLDSVGAHVWREMLHRVDLDALWAEPFDPADPVGTPRGLAAPPADRVDPVLHALAEAVGAFALAGVAIDAPLGALQFADRRGERVPVHGGEHREGVTNVVGWGSFDTTEPLPERAPEVAEDGRLRTDGYQVANGTSFLFAVHFTADGPEAFGFLTYANTGDREAEAFRAATERFAAKDWRLLAFTPGDVAAAERSRRTVTG